MKKIIFYAASDQNVPSNRIGGAEVGARRTYNILVDRGFDVTYIPKVNKLNGIFRFIKDLFFTLKTLKKLILEYKGNAIFYITAFYKKQAFIEHYLINKAKRKNLKIIYEPKNGSFVKRFNDGNKSYKKLINKTLAKCDYIFCQGQEYVDFIETICPGKCVYIPNYVEKIDDHIPEDNGVIDLVYFGRISSSKNVGLILDICSLLSKTKKVSCKIIGSCDSDYGKSLIEKCKLLNLNDKVSFLGRLPLSEIKQQCASADFFIFPSNEEEEGHSNSLTEAMSFGLIPVVSTNGFSKSIVGDEKFVVEKFDASEYVDRIITLSDNLLINKKFAKNRIQNNYTSNIVIERQLECLKAL